MQKGLFLAETISSTVPVSSTYGLITVIPAASQYSAFGERFPIGQETRRSSGSVSLPLLDISGQLVGQIQLSEGPGFGWAIVTSVFLAWAAAGIIAILLSAAVGWRISQRVTAPLTALAGVTERMAAGDLSARAYENKADEFGALARSFNGMAGRVEETVLALRQFVSDAAHELQTPITALRTNLELALGEKEPDRQTAFLHRAEVQVERLSSLSQDLLDLSRLEAGANRNAPASVDLARLLREVSEGYAARAEQRGQTFTLEIETDVPLVTGDQSQLRRAIGNLLDNAVKFTPARGSVRARLESAGDEARLVIEDTGIGIPTEDLASLFSRFHRGRNAAGYPGSGLGLAMVKAIAKAHGGSVTAENLPAGGSRFTFTCSIDSIPIGEPRRQ
jgi:two-component system sensor histidine kinase MprB